MLRAVLKRWRLLGKRLADCQKMFSRFLAYIHQGLDLNQWATTLIDGGAPVASSSKRADLSCRPALQRLTERGEEDLLQSILEKLPPANLLQAARVSFLLPHLQF